LPCSNFLFLQSLKLDFDDIEDAVIYNLAIQNKSDYFITNDKQALKKLATKKLPIITTKDFLVLMNVL
jgi:predicted nucleic acid-binding protein